ncbi:MAG TPA: HIT domain-containing protein [Dehalococcoidia bacterium]
MTTAHAAGGACRACTAVAQAASLPGGVILDAGGWRLVHNEDTPLPGHLLLYAVRHVERPADLTPEEAAALGGLAARVDAALRDVLGAGQTYVVSITEGATHLHVHFLPIQPHVPAIGRGVGIFRFLERGEPVEPGRIEELAARLRAALAT